MYFKGVGTRGNPDSPNVPPKSDLERIIREDRARQRESSSSIVEF